MEMFKQATKKKLRFEYKGNLTTEDLWDLSLQDLDFIYKDLNSSLKKENEESLLQERSQEDQILDLKIEIVKHVFQTKMEEKEAKEKEKERKEQRQKLLRIAEEKEEDELRGKSAQELKKMADQLAE